MIKIIIKGDPKTKKNSQQVVITGGKHMIVPSKAYKDYRQLAFWQIPGSARAQLPGPVNVKAVYYMQTRRRVDLVNLLEATLDILVDAEVLEDDNARVVVSMDGSRVRLDPEDPRAEIEIEEAEEHEEPSPV